MRSPCLVGVVTGGPEQNHAAWSGIPEESRLVRLVFMIAMMVGGVAGAPGAVAQPTSFGGTWDLTWQTRKGDKREGQLVIAQRGRLIDAEIRSHGTVKAEGTLSGSTFNLRGRRMAIPYTMSGRVGGNEIEGTLKVLSVTRHFTGVRRP
jgi:hypothetical protein